MLETILYIVGIIGFSLVIIDSVTEWISKYKKRNEKDDLQAWKRSVDDLYNGLDHLERRLMGKITIVDHSITNLATRDKELEEMIRWYAGELKKDELKDWTYILPDGSVETHSLRDEVEDPPVLEDKEDQMSFFDILCEAFQQRQMMSEEEEDEESQSEED